MKTIEEVIDMLKEFILDNKLPIIIIDGEIVDLSPVLKK